MRIMIGIIVALIVGIIVLGWLYRSEAKQSAQYEQAVEQQQAVIDDMNDQLAEIEEQRKEAEAIATQYKNRADSIRDKARRLRNELRKLSEEKKEVRDWANADLPDDVVNLIMRPNEDDNRN